MKKILAMFLALAMAASLAACGSTPAETTTKATEEATTTTTEATSEEVVTEEDTTEEATSEEAPAAVMSYAEYAAAEIDSPVTVECYVQAHQSWWDGKLTVYAADEDGAYFLYNMACEEADAEKMVPGTKICVTGYKSEWSGEVEITDATFEFAGDDTFVAEAADLTEVFGTDALADNMNKFFTVKGAVVAASKDADENEVAFLYNWDGSGSQGDDLYFNVTIGEETYNFTVESYLCGKDTEVYQAVEGLKVGDTVDLEGFLYWYNGANPHITSCVVK